MKFIVLSSTCSKLFGFHTNLSQTYCFQKTRLNSENNLLFIAVAGEIGFMTFDLVCEALAFNQVNLDIISNASTNIPAIEGQLNEPVLENFAVYTVILDIIAILQILLQTFCTLILTSEDSNLKMSLKLKRVVTFLLSYMIISNIAIWGYASIILLDDAEGKVSLYVVNEIVLGAKNWKFVSTFLYPLVLFYRFHSAKLILVSLNHTYSADIALDRHGNRVRNSRQLNFKFPSIFKFSKTDILLISPEFASCDDE